VAALRTAVTVGQALANQRLVLGQITALNTTTANIIDSTSQLLRDQTGRSMNRLLPRLFRLRFFNARFRISMTQWTWSMILS
jgi:hypothetical protein